MALKTSKDEDCTTSLGNLPPFCIPCSSLKTLYLSMSRKLFHHASVIPACLSLEMWWSLLAKTLRCCCQKVCAILLRLQMQPTSVSSETSSVFYSFTYRFKYSFTKTKAVYSRCLNELKMKFVAEGECGIFG